MSFGDELTLQAVQDSNHEGPFRGLKVGLIANCLRRVMFGTQHSVVSVSDFNERRGLKVGIHWTRQSGVPGAPKHTRHRVGGDIASCVGRRNGRDQEAAGKQTVTGV